MRYCPKIEIPVGCFGIHLGKFCLHGPSFPFGCGDPQNQNLHPQVVAHHVDAHFLHELLVVNVQYRLAVEHLRFKGKIRILRARIFGTAEAVLNVSCSLL